LYKKARAGEIQNFTGIDSPYEAPRSPELVVKNDSQSVQKGVEKILSQLIQAKIISADTK
jgi:adenylylsulfate kinase-like enzyme